MRAATCIHIWHYESLLYINNQSSSKKKISLKCLSQCWFRRFARSLICFFAILSFRHFVFRYFIFRCHAPLLKCAFAVVFFAEKPFAHMFFAQRTPYPLLYSVQFFALIPNMTFVLHKSNVVMQKIENYRQYFGFFDLYLKKMDFLNKEREFKKNQLYFWITANGELFGVRARVIVVNT